MADKMKLLTSNTTPFGRKALIAAMVLGMDDRLDIVNIVPYDDATLRTINPLGRIPVLIDGDRAIYDSVVIALYLQEKAGKDILMQGGDFLTLMQLHALSDGIAVAGVNRAQNKMRHLKNDAIPLDDWYVGRQSDSIILGLKEAENRLADFGNAMNLPVISLICTLDHVTFRHGDLAWQEKYPTLAKWRDDMDRHDFIKNTAPRL